MPTDLYAESGEFIDVLSQDAWRALATPISQALGEAAPRRGPILDIGAGTGLGTLLVAGTVPAGEVIAVEPSPVLRAVLLSRLAVDDDLRRRVTVQATTVDGMRLPGRLGGVLAINMIGHLSASERRRLWTDLRPWLAPVAPLIVNLQPPAEPTVIPESAFASVPIGRRTYQGSGGARPQARTPSSGPCATNVLDQDGAVDSELVVDYPWHVLSPPGLLAELTAAGYTATLREMDVVVATPRQ